MTVNVCDHEGWLVNRELPADPIDHDAELLPTIGCTNLRCGLCGMKVRSATDRTYASTAGVVDIDALYATDVLAASPQLKAIQGMRLYTCCCAFHVETNESRLDDKEGAQVATQWTCVGHPIATLPHTFDGVEITTDNLERYVEDSIRGDVPPGARPVDRADGVWAARMCTRLEKTPYADRVAKVVAAHVADADLATRVRALYFFVNVPSHAGAMRPAALLGDHAALFVGVTNPRSNTSATRTLEYLIWRIAGKQLAVDAALRDLAHAFAMDPARASDVLFIALAQNDPRWFTDNAAKLATANPARRQELLDAASGAQLRDARAAIKAVPRA
ncbi:MAG: hypothetical protein AB7T06_16895 [Kofleriaceae bacterium]